MKVTECGNRRVSPICNGARRQTTLPLTAFDRLLTFSCSSFGFSFPAYATEVFLGSAFNGGGDGAGIARLDTSNRFCSGIGSKPTHSGVELDKSPRINRRHGAAPKSSASIALTKVLCHFVATDHVGNGYRRCSERFLKLWQWIHYTSPPCSGVLTGFANPGQLKSRADQTVDRPDQRPLSSS